MITIFPRSRISFICVNNFLIITHSFSILSQNFQAWFYLFEHVKHQFHHLSLIIPLSVVLGICFCCLLFLDIFNSYCLISLWGWLSSIMNFDLKDIYRNNFKPRIMLFFSRCLLLPDAWEIYTLSSFKFNYSSIKFGRRLWNSLKLISSSQGSMLTSCLFYWRANPCSLHSPVYPWLQFFSLSPTSL